MGSLGGKLYCIHLNLGSHNIQAFVCFVTFVPQNYMTNSEAPRPSALRDTLSADWDLALGQILVSWYSNNRHVSANRPRQVLKLDTHRASNLWICRRSRRDSQLHLFSQVLRRPYGKECTSIHMTICEACQHAKSMLLGSSLPRVSSTRR